MCRVAGCSRPPGGGRLASAFTTLCNAHRRQARRHGDPRQHPVRVPHLRPYVQALERRRRLRPNAQVWDLLNERWRTLADACQATIRLFETGQPMDRREVEAAREIAKVAREATPRDAWQTAVGMCWMVEAEPRRFASHEAFLVQLGRRVRHLADTSKGSYWNPDTGRVKLVYKDPTPRVAVLIGRMLLDVFGVTGAHFARQDEAEAASKAAERQAIYDALREVTPEAVT